YVERLTKGKKVPTGEACRILENKTQKKITSDYLLKQAKRAGNRKLEIEYSLGILIAEIVYISPSNRYYWDITEQPYILSTTAA
ncbi:MAG: hypothetical protein ACLBM2_00880, partial [Dolichospermum sp.]